MPTLTTTRPVPENFNPRPLQEVLAKQKSGKKPLRVTFDKYPVYADDPLRESHLLLDAYLRAAMPNAFDVKPAKLPAGRAILESPIDQWPRHLTAMLARLLFYWTHSVKEVKDEMLGQRAWRYDEGVMSFALKPLATAMLRRELLFTDQELTDLVESSTIGGEVGNTCDWCFPPSQVVRACEEFKSRTGLTPPLRAALAKLRKSRAKFISDYGGDRKERELSERLETLLGKAAPQRELIVEPGEPWADAVLEFTAKPGDSAAKWEALLNHGAAGSGSKPSGKWLKEAKKLVDAIGAKQFAPRAAEWLQLAVKPRTIRLRENQIAKVWLADCDIYSNKNEDVLKGFVWACGAAGDPQLTRPLGELAEISYKKIRNVGPRSPKVGNACLISLIALPGQPPRAELSRLKARVKQPTARKMIDKALGASAAAAGMTTDDLEELAVETYGFQEVGRGQQKIGSFEIELRIRGTSVDVAFVDSKGKTRSSVPAELKRDFAAPVKQLAQTTKDLPRMLSALRDRLERMPMNRRELPYAAWRERYLDHPVVGTLARRLIWSFGDAAVGAWRDGKLVDASDKPLKSIENTIVRLWHPSIASAQAVLAWRQWLERHEVTQPFKQAHREVYLLTDAERATQSYSNRFAAHVLRQHVLAALCTQRGWKYRLVGSWDGGGDTMPIIELPKWELRAEYWITLGIGDEVGETGVAQFVTTDQVRFTPLVRGDNARPLKLEKVPPLVFSEVMRDVDLFVGVASVGNDPTWNAGGQPGRLGAYWQSYSFGDLSATAATRRQVLERLIPRLKIAKRCSLAERFLVVRGDKRTYKIHLGSANILMEPNDQYLCIVPERKARRDESADLFLPFEGDATLSIIISKALLLADDTKIDDPTITRQIDQK